MLGSIRKLRQRSKKHNPTTAAILQVTFEDRKSAGHDSNVAHIILDVIVIQPKEKSVK
jgi:hypothetical protein